MKLGSFEYAAPASVKEAVDLLAANPGAKIISGGQSLIPLLAFRLSAPSLLVDIKGIDGLGAIEINEDGICLGARVRWVDIERDARLEMAHPLLAAAIAHVAHYQIRNRGTVGGSLSHADPAAEMPGVAITCEAVIELAGPEGTRHVPADAFFLGSLETVIAEDEMLVAVRLPAWKPDRKWAFLEFARRQGDFALAGVLLYYDRDPRGLVVNAHIGAIGVGSCACRLAEAEAVLNGKTLDEATIAEVVATASRTLEPFDDLHAKAEYRRRLYCTLLERALRSTLSGEEPS